MRPEKVHVEDYGPQHVNRLMGTVKETIYHGDHTRLRLAVAGNPEFTVKMRFRPNRPRPEVGELGGGGLCRGGLPGAGRPGGSGELSLGRGGATPANAGSTTA